MEPNAVEASDSAPRGDGQGVDVFDGTLDTAGEETSEGGRLLVGVAIATDEIRALNRERRTAKKGDTQQTFEP